MNIAVITCKAFECLTVQDQILVPEFAKRGCKAIPIVWDEFEGDFSDFDFILIRSPWDYFVKIDGFLKFLGKLKKSNSIVVNSVKTVEWNMHKFYLRDLAELGVKIIPTVFCGIGQNQISTISEEWERVVVKPAISAGAHLTKVVDVHTDKDKLEKYSLLNNELDLLVQPFMQEISDIGETSFVFFNKIYQHAVLKKPKANEFRIQYQFGGIYQRVYPTIELINQARFIINSIEEELAYARVDGIVINETLHLMELELIEPDLYLNLAPENVNNFIDSVLNLYHSENNNS